MNLFQKASYTIITAKQLVLVGKKRHFTMKERPSTIPKQVVLVSEAISPSLQLGRKRGKSPSWQ
jgi:hypothetical protein